jgi:hypothetical protein
MFAKAERRQALSMRSSHSVPLKERISYVRSRQLRGLVMRS